MERVLTDTGALLALFESRDRYHARARVVAERVRSTGGLFVSTTAILTELSNLLLIRHGPERTARALGVLFADPTYQWVDVGLDLAKESVRTWLERFSDQRFTLTDAISFEVMRRNGITHAFSFDQRFVKAGFSLLD